MLEKKTMFNFVKNYRILLKETIALILYFDSCLYIFIFIFIYIYIYIYIYLYKMKAELIIQR